MNNTIVDFDEDMRCSHDDCHENFICVGMIMFMVGGFGVAFVYLVKFIVGDI
jgi:hypothetical protein